MKKDDKKLALFLLKTALVHGTREHIVDLILSEDVDTVTVLYDRGYSFNVNVACDSACAMLYDVMKAINERL